MPFLEILYTNVLPFILVLSVLVFVHESGHYSVARWVGVRVEVFSIGFGPELFGWNDRHGTRWKVSAIPLGGYVKMFGETDNDDSDTLSPEERAVSFQHKTVFQRIAVVAAGPLANFIFAIAVFAVLFSVVGKPVPLAAVGAIGQGSVAESRGFQPGDRILSVNDVALKTFDELRREVSNLPGVQSVFVIERDGETVKITATPARYTYTDNGQEKVIGRLGVGPDLAQFSYEKQNPFTASLLAVDRSIGLSTQILSYLGGIISGKESADELGGPIRIAQISGEMAQKGLFNIVFFTAVLSLNLALINLFPIPMLDGGHLVFYIIEAIRGKPVTARIQEYSFRFGLILVLLVLFLTTWNDLSGISVFE